MKKINSVILALLLTLSFNLVSFAASGSVSGIGETQQNIDVNATYSASVSTPEVVSVDISWGAMEFTYSVGGTNNWNPGTHSYNENTSGSWTATGNNITVTNHSNVAVEAELSFAASVNGIIGKFTESSDIANDSLLSLPSAVGTSVANAPSATATFNITGGSVSADGKIGSITVSISKAPYAVTALGTNTTYELYTTSQQGVYTATIQRGNDNSSAYNNSFVYYPEQFVNVGIPEVNALIASNSSVKGIILNSNGTITTATNANYDEKATLGLATANEYLLTLNFSTMSWSIEVIE